MATKSKSSKKGGAAFGYVEQFNYPLSPCYKNTAKAGWHSGGDGSCAKKTVEGYSTDSEQVMNGGGFFDWLLGKNDMKTTATSGKSKDKKKKSSSSTTEKKKKKSSTKTEKKKKTSKK